MTRVVLAAKAADDVLTILADLLVAAGRHTASSYDARFRRLLARLSDHPQSGSPRPKLGLSIRIVVLSPYVVFYSYDLAADVVQIVRVIHHRRRFGLRDLRH